MPNFKQITPFVGAEVSDYDIVSNTDDTDIQELKDALNKYHVLVFRDQELTPPKFSKFMSVFGEPCIHPTSTRKVADQLEVIRFDVSPISTTVPGSQWHCDLTCEQCPPMYTALWIDDCPDCGGDTAFINMHAAYNFLSDGMKKYCNGLSVKHSGTVAWGTGSDASARNSIHPMVVSHPDTGKPILYFNLSFSKEILSIGHIEDFHIQALMKQLVLGADVIKARISWQPKTLVIWDNFSVQHKAIFDYKGQSRRGLRMMSRPLRPEAYKGN
jgi:taurine dioxygenase